MTMPPIPLEYLGRELVARFLHAAVQQVLQAEVFGTRGVRKFAGVPSALK